MSFFGYILDHWDEDLQCMAHATKKLWPDWKDDYELRRWAFSVVKTRGFSFVGTREKNRISSISRFFKSSARK